MFLFPKVCGICKSKINKNNTCEKCSNILKYTMKMELTVRKINLYVDELVSLFIYKSFIRNKILEFKFEGRAYMAYTFAEFMCEAIKANHLNVDLVMPVPIHRKRLMERGYNQSELLSRYISKNLKIRHCKSLFKKKNNIVQSSLNYEKRWSNVINAYSIRFHKNFSGKRILLIDDIYTTGATVNECAKILKQNGATEVIALTIAYVKHECGK